MRNEQSAVLTSLRGAQQFLDSHSDALAAVNTSTRKQLDYVVTQLSELIISQEISTRGSKGETSRQRALRLALRRNYMAPVAELARLNLRSVPEFSALTLPPSHSTAERAVAAAYAMADAASAHAQILIASGLPASFAEDLRIAAAQVSESLAGRNKHRGERTGATAGLAAEERRGRVMLRVLNALIMAHIGNDAQLLAEWTSAKLVRRKPGPAAGSQATDPTPIHPVVVVPVTATPAASPVAVAA